MSAAKLASQAARGSEAAASTASALPTFTTSRRAAATEKLKRALASRAAVAVARAVGDQRPRRLQQRRQPRPR